MRSKLGRHLGPLSLLGVSVSLLGCFDNTPSSSLAASARPPEATVEAPAGDREGKTAATDQKTPPAEPVPAKLTEIVKLLDAKVADEVILAYIHREDRNYDLTADEVVFLRRRGMNDGVLAALVRNPAPRGPVAEEPLAPTASVALEPSPAVALPLANPAPAPPETLPAPDPATVVTQYVAVAETPAPATVQYFNTYLAPHGSWVNVSGYGSCWQPTVVLADPTWQPYCNGGRWVWTDAGWYWQSDYSWGWATFHYGRWSRDHRAGWVWVPGSVWAPAWVSWRNSADYCGWAPLPPAAHYTAGIGLTYRGRHVGVDFGFGLASDCYSFVDARRLDDHAWHRYRLGPRETDIIFSGTRPINRYEQGPGGLVNEGIAHEWFGHDPAGRRRIPVKLDDIPSHGGMKPDDWRDHGRSLAVFRPRGFEQSIPARTGYGGRDLPSPRQSQSDNGNESPRLHVNGVAVEATIQQRSNPAWWRNNDRPATPGRTAVAGVPSGSDNSSLANPRQPLRRDASHPESSSSSENLPDSRIWHRPDASGRQRMEKFQLPANASPRDNRASGPVSNERTHPQLDPRGNARAETPGGDFGSTDPSLRPPRFAPFNPSPRSRGFTPLPSPTPAPLFDRPAPQPVLRPTNPFISPQTAPPAGPRMFRPTPQVTFIQPRFERPVVSVATPSPQPRFQMPVPPAMPRLPSPRFQQPPQPNQYPSQSRGVQYR